jgi:hypothetical protein
MAKNETKNTGPSAPNPKADEIMAAGEANGDVSAVRRISPLRKGNKVFIRTETHYFVGQVAAWDDDELVLVNATWVADTGMFDKCLNEGQMNEYEPYPKDTGGLVSVSRGCVVDITPWIHELPTKSKRS